LSLEGSVRGKGPEFSPESILSFRFQSHMSSKYGYNDTHLKYIRPFVMYFHNNVADKGSVHTLNRIMDYIVKAETAKLVQLKYSVNDPRLKEDLIIFERSIREAIIDIDLNKK
jgi:hypothetical protein